MLNSWWVLSSSTEGAGAGSAGSPAASRLRNRWPAAQRVRRGVAGNRGETMQRMLRVKAHISKLAAFLPYTATPSDDPEALAPNEGGVRCGEAQADATTRLRVFMQEHPEWSWGRRVCGSLRSFAPANVCWTDTREAADVEIVHVDGENELAYAETLKTTPFVAIQHGLTQQNAWQARPPREAFAQVWQRALLTASFQDLAADAATGHFPFYPMPWGADEHVFVPPADGKPANERAPSVLIFGNLGESPGDDESNGAVLYAAALAGLRGRHVGDPGDSLCHPCPAGVPAAGETDTGRLLCSPMPSLGGRAPCSWHDNLGRISDAAMVLEMQRARYAAVLRKHEGFEMPGMEALFCGARPIVFDLPSYRWYRGHAVFLNASLGGAEHAAELTAALKELPAPVAAAELEQLRAEFAWQRLVPDLFEQIASRLRVAQLARGGSFRLAPGDRLRVGPGDRASVPVS